MEKLETVKIEGKDGDHIVINESEFDPKKHKLFVEKEEKAKGKGKDSETEEK